MRRLAGEGADRPWEMDSSWGRAYCGPRPTETPTEALDVGQPRWLIY